MVSNIYLSLGSNLGDRGKNLADANRHLNRPCQVIRSSSIYETEPWGYADQPAFLNQVIEVETDLSAPQLLAAIKAIENDLGRQTNFHYGPRLIDIDILLYDQLIYQSPTLTIPHAMLEKRAFVLVPLVELAPQLTHPVSGKTMQNLLADNGSSGVRLLQPDQKGPQFA